MDQSWMKASRISDEYENGVEQFLQFTERNAQSLGGKIFYPCAKCVNGRRRTVNEIRSYLICHGIILNYSKWIWHGQLPNMPTVSRTELVDEDIRDGIKDMICDLRQDYFQQAHAPLYEKIESDSKKSLYSGCAKKSSSRSLWAISTSPFLL